MSSSLSPTSQPTFQLVSLARTPSVTHRISTIHSTLIGRSPSTDLTLQNPSVSNKHAIISQRGKYVYLRDMESTNGTFINGEKLSRGEMREISHGDILRFGFDDHSWRLMKQQDDSPLSSSSILSNGNNKSSLSPSRHHHSTSARVRSPLVTNGGADRSSSSRMPSASRINTASSIHEDYLSKSRAEPSHRLSSSSRHLSPSRHSSPSSSRRLSSSQFNNNKTWKSTTEHLEQLEQRVGYLEDTALNHHNIESTLKRQQVTLLASIRHLAHDLSMKLSNYSVSAKVKEAKSVKDMLDQIEEHLQMSNKDSSRLIRLVNDLRDEKESLKFKLTQAEEQNQLLLREKNDSSRFEQEEVDRLRMQKSKCDERILDLESELKEKKDELFELKEKLSLTGERSLRKYHLLDVQNEELKRSNEDLRQELRSTHDYLSTVHSQLVESKSPKPHHRKRDASLDSSGVRISVSSPIGATALLKTPGSDSRRESSISNRSDANQDYIDYLRRKLDEKEEDNVKLRSKLNRISLTMEGGEE